MRKLVFFFFLFALISSCGQSKEITASLVSDCTGTYIRHLNVDWKVCNDRDVPLSTNGLEVQIKYKDVKECSDTTARCIWYHPFAKSVLIRKVNMPK